MFVEIRMKGICENLKKYVFKTGLNKKWFKLPDILLHNIMNTKFKNKMFLLDLMRALITQYMSSK